MPEVGIGLFPDVGASYFLSRMPWPLGLYLGLSTARLDGSDAVTFGVATHFIKSKKLPLLEEELRKSQGEKGDLDKIFASFSSAPPNYSAVLSNWKKISEIFSLHSVDSIVYALEKDGSEWASTTLQKMKTSSPTAIKVCFEQIHRGKNLNILHTFKQEYTLALNFMKKPDFFEGVRALLIDKTSKPHWSPPTFAEVTHDTVLKYFTPIPNEREFIPK